MLQGRLTSRSIVTAIAVTALAACGGGALEDNVVRPGITAIDQSEQLACGTDRGTLQTAIEAYTLLNNNPPTDEATLVTEQFLREPSENWNIVNGQIVAQNPACGAVPDGTMPPIMTAPATTLGEIVTATEPPMTAEQVLASFSEAEIASVGGIDCATELAAVLVAGDRYVEEQGIAPIDLEDLFVAGYLTERATLWTASADSLLPAPGSPCVDPSATTGE